MKTSPIQPAQVDFSDADAPAAPQFGDVYHSRAGAFAQADHVFLGGNGLPARWQRRERFVILETGFGLGNNFLAAWQRWRDDALRCARLHFISVEKHPLRRDDLARAHASAASPALAQELVRAWPPLTPNLHRLAFDDGRVELLLAFGDVHEWLPELIASVDAFFLDGFAPAKNPAMWEPRVFKALARCAAPGATAATWSVAREVRDGLADAGFVVERAAGFGGKRDMTVARYAPTFAARRPAGRVLRSPSRRTALIVGAGLAGASAAYALTQRGFDCTVLDRHASPAAETSGNPAGLFHGVINRDDGPHARAHRAAALEAAWCFAPLLAQGAVPGSMNGVLRTDKAEPASMRSLIGTLALPPDYVQAMDADQASSMAGVPMDSAAWFYPHGGWIDPGALVRHWLSGLRFAANAAVDALRRDGEQWQALDAKGRVVAQASIVVLANALDALRLLGNPRWPLRRVRGQISLVPAGTPGLRPPRVPVAGAGYALTLSGGAVVCGATLSERDDEALLRTEDHAHNLAQLARLTGSAAQVEPSGLNGRVGWRVLAADRLPLIGPVPLSTMPGGQRIDQPRLVPREDGLFVFTALGSRGIAWAPLGGQLIAAWASGAPLPLESSLVDALDPARFVSRAARTSAS